MVLTQGHTYTHTHTPTHNEDGKIRAGTFVAFYCCLNIIVAVSFYYYHQLLSYLHLIRLRTRVVLYDINKETQKH